jgi:MoaA/NifB/PqqE/SkfB family radical SAM enzyme
MKNPNLSDQSKYVSITMEFRCNLKCTHCMIEGTMDTFDPGGEIQFQSILNEQKESKRWDGLILTGSEITLNKKLPDMAVRARESGFDYVRIQTHGMHLHREEYLRKLLNSGVNEFFISVAGANSDTHDGITKVKGSFDKLMIGINMIEEFADAIIITNTVVTQQSYRELEEIVDMFAEHKKVIQHEFWNFFPMSESDEKNLIVAYPVLMPFIMDAIKACKKYNKISEVKKYTRVFIA